MFQLVDARMNSGIFCKTKSATDVYNSILIDEYHKCVFGDSKSKAKQMSTMDAAAGTPMEETVNIQEWKPDMIVRAPYIVNDEVQYYEAKIQRIFQDKSADKFAIVEFFGYSEEQIVKLSELRTSQGTKAIEEQIAISNEYYEDEDNEEEEEEKIDWKVGMPCRAYYEPMDVIYEATIEEVDPVTRRATVKMIGYELRYTVNFDVLYKSDQSLREKQLRSAAQHTTVQSDLNRLNFGHKSSPKVNTGRRSEADECTFESRPQRPNDTVDPPIRHHSGKNIIQPKDEDEALACLLSANYLSGYYAGYYDCMKKVPMKNQSEISANRGTCT